MNSRTVNVCALMLVAVAAGCSRTPAPPPAPNITGLWDAVIVAINAEVPFRFEIAQNGSQAEGFFFEGDRKVGSTSGTFDTGALKAAEVRADLLAGLNPGVRLVPSHVMAMGLVQERGVTYVKI